MVEVSPQKGEIQVRSGWLFFTAFALITFGLLFYFVPNTGWYWYALGAGVILSFVIDFFVFSAPMIILILILIGILTFAGVKFWL